MIADELINSINCSGNGGVDGKLAEANSCCTRNAPWDSSGWVPGWTTIAIGFGGSRPQSGIVSAIALYDIRRPDCKGTPPKHINYWISWVSGHPDKGDRPGVEEEF
jgi:hypothetical protein